MGPWSTDTEDFIEIIACVGTLVTNVMLLHIYGSDVVIVDLRAVRNLLGQHILFVDLLVSHYSHTPNILM